ncbi:PREDICTED: acylphosphatase-2-like [Chlamydotis macqueenii]|nr:PREDICTED: acylphosphatase-2-like [Chlamydotis macqueenii]
MTCVCFRMYTEEEARKLGVVGWVKNTRQGTVTGQVQGPEDKVNAM